MSKEKDKDGATASGKAIFGNSNNSVICIDSDQEQQQSNNLNETVSNKENNKPKRTINEFLMQQARNQEVQKTPVGSSSKQTPSRKQVDKPKVTDGRALSQENKTPIRTRIMSIGPSPRQEKKVCKPTPKKNQELQVESSVEEKKKRGRPSKSLNSLSQDQSESVKKKRGRPSKSLNSLSQDQSGSVTKKRGRPSKSLNSLSQDHSGPVKKKRGRPSKSLNSSSQDQLEPVEKKKKRGRPSKRLNSLSQDQLEPVQEKKKRGRPTKSLSQDQSEASTSQDQSINEQESTVAEKKKRGRPSKSLNSLNQDQLIATTSQDQSKNEQEPTVKEKKKRGRPSKSLNILDQSQLELVKSFDDQSYSEASPSSSKDTSLQSVQSTQSKRSEDLAILPNRQQESSSNSNVQVEKSKETSSLVEQPNEKVIKRKIETTAIVAPPILVKKTSVNVVNNDAPKNTPARRVTFDLPPHDLNREQVPTTSRLSVNKNNVLSKTDASNEKMARRNIEPRTLLDDNDIKRQRTEPIQLRRVKSEIVHENPGQNTAFMDKNETVILDDDSRPMLQSQLEIELDEEILSFDKQQIKFIRAENYFDGIKQKHCHLIAETTQRTQIWKKEFSLNFNCLKLNKYWILLATNVGRDVGELIYFSISNGTFQSIKHYDCAIMSIVLDNHFCGIQLSDNQIFIRDLRKQEDGLSYNFKSLLIRIAKELFSFEISNHGLPILFMKNGDAWFYSKKYETWRQLQSRVDIDKLSSFSAHFNFIKQVLPNGLLSKIAKNIKQLSIQEISDYVIPQEVETEKLELILSAMEELNCIEEYPLLAVIYVHHLFEKNKTRRLYDYLNELVAISKNTKIAVDQITREIHPLLANNQTVKKELAVMPTQLNEELHMEEDLGFLNQH